MVTTCLSVWLQRAGGEFGKIMMTVMMKGKSISEVIGNEERDRE